VVRGNDTVVATGPQIVLAHGIVQVRVTITAAHQRRRRALAPARQPHSWAARAPPPVKLRSEVLTSER